MPVYFHSEIPGFSLRQKTKLKEWVTSTIRDHSLKPGELNFIFCTDEYLHKINVEYLDHDTFTDIITFPQEIPGKPDQIHGDIYISVDRVTENAKKFGVEMEHELHRVIIHGVLHLCGMSDKGSVKKELMRKAEDKYLKMLPS